MQVHRDIEHLPPFKNAVVTIGTFDGVHAGHQQIIAQLKKEAQQVQGETVIITFHPHPRKVVQHGQSPVFVLTDLAEKMELLRAKGIDHLVVVPFTNQFASQTAEEYITGFLFNRFHPHTIIIGYDHKFGNERRGDYHMLEDFGGKLGFAVKEIPEHVLDDVTISSTRVREALKNGDVATANNYLGHDYFFEGTVVKGNQLGRQLGYPTANLQVEDAEKLVPGNGIYAVEASIVNREPSIVSREPSVVRRESSVARRESSMSDESLIDVKEGAALNLQSAIYNPKYRLKGMMSIGIRPTIGGTDRVIEVNIFDFNEDIYGKTLRVYLKKYLRPEVKFNSLAELTQQLHKDKEDTLIALNN